MKFSKLLSTMVFLASLMSTQQAIGQIGGVTDSGGSSTTGSVNPCGNNPCLNGGTCSQTLDSFSCLCAAPYFGPTCDFIDDTTGSDDTIGSGDTSGSGDTTGSDEESDNPMDAVGGYFPEMDFTVPEEKPVLVPTPAAFALYVIGFVGLIGLGWSRRKRYS